MKLNNRLLINLVIILFIERVTCIVDNLGYRIIADDFDIHRIMNIALRASTPDGSTFGGISGLAYYSNRELYYAISNDIETSHSASTTVPKTTLDASPFQSAVLWEYSTTPTTTKNTTGSTVAPTQPQEYSPRFYSMRISRSSYSIIDAISLKNNQGVSYKAGDFKPESIAYHNSTDTIFVSLSKGSKLGPGIWQFSLSGVRLGTMTLPTFFDIQDNNGFRSLDINRKDNKLWTGTEFGFNNDNRRDIRLTEFDISTKKVERQFVYETEAGVGLVELVVLDDNGSFLALEGNGELYYVLCHEALDVNNIARLFGRNTTKVQKFGLGHVPGQNIQAMAVEFPTNSYDESSSSSRDDDDEYFLVLMGDNNFVNATDVITADLEVDLSTGIALPTKETQDVTGTGISGAIANDPAIWVDPDDTDQSLVIATLLGGGLAVYDLNGNELNSWTGNYHSVDIIYAFKLDEGDLIDVAVVSKGNDEAISIWRIRNSSPYLTDVTSGGSIRVGDPAYDVATYTSPFTSKMYVFVASGDEIMQIKLEDNGSGRIRSQNRNNYRVIHLRGDADGIVVDRETGHLYVALSDRNEIIKFDAEPDEEDEDDYSEVADDDDLGHSKIRGMTMYYNGYLDGYLIVSLEDESSFAIFKRNDDNDYVGRFTVGGTNFPNAIDRTDATRGIDVININLGPDFACGVFLTQDNNNDSTNFSRHKTNFKLVPFDNVYEALNEHLTLDTESWGPRRFALALWIESLAQDIYCAQNKNDISGRDAEKLLYYLSSAAYYLYKPGTKKRQMIEPFYTTRYRSGRSSRRLGTNRGRRRHLRRQTRSLLSSAVVHSGSRSGHDDKGEHQSHRNMFEKCDVSSNSSSRDGENKKGMQYMRKFIQHVRDLRSDRRLNDLDRDDVSYWLDLASDIRDNIPAEMDESDE